MKRSASLTSGMSLKTVLTWAAVAFVLWWVIQQPAAAAHLVHNIGAFLTAAAAGLSAFVASMPTWMVAVPILVVALVVALPVIRRLAQSARHRWDESTATSLLGGLTRFSALLAGGRRPHAREEWQANVAYSIAGADGSQSAPRIVRYAIGLIVAAIKYRLHDAADLIWRPIDFILASRKLSNLTVSTPTLAAIVVVVNRDGIYGLVSDAENLLAIGGFFYAAIRAGRHRRGVKPAKHKPSGARK